MNTEVEPGQGGDQEVMDEDNVFEEKEDDEVGAEGVDVKVMKRPEEPTQEEIDKHMCTHIPFRSWCSHCVMGKAKNSRHAKRGSQENEVPVVSIDYTFMGSDDKGDAAAEEGKSGYDKGKRK